MPERRERLGGLDELTIEAHYRWPDRYATDWDTLPPPSALSRARRLPCVSRPSTRA